MTRRLTCVALLLICWCGCDRNGGSTDGETTESHQISPVSDLNILLITVDTLRADALGAYGNPRARTPWMDRLAAEGVRFDMAQAHNVVTLPAHATILTGLYPQQHGIRDNSGFRLPEELTTLASILRREGYRTSAFVSAFPLDSRFGLDRGFEIYEDSFVGAGRRPVFLEQERSGIRTVALAQDWIESVAGEPWFCWVHLYEPHFPYDPPESLRASFEDNLYLGDVAAADAALGPLLDSILDGVEGPDTLVVLTSDHGEALGEHGEATHGIFAYQSTLKVPLVLHQPRVLSPRVIEEPVRHIDLLPTLLDLLSLSMPDNLPGTSLLPVIRGTSRDHPPPVYFEALSGQLNRGWAPLYGVLDGDLKFIDLPIPELYDLAEDPREAHNLATERSDRVVEMRSLLDDFQALDVGIARSLEDEETLRRLEGLGYLTGSEKARSTYTEADDPKNLIDLDVALREVGGLYARGDLDAALSKVRAITDQRPGMRLALLQRAQLERESGDLEAAVETLQEAYRLNPADDGTLALLGAYLTQAGRAAEAVEITDPHSKATEPDLDVLLVRALAQARARDPGAAMATLKEAQGIDPTNPMVPVHQGTLHLLAGDRMAAREAFEAALSLNVETVAALTALGILGVEEGRLDEGTDYWRQAVTLDPQQLPRLLAFASGLWNRGDAAAARSLIEVFLAVAPPDVYASEIARLRQLLASTG